MRRLKTNKSFSKSQLIIFLVIFAAIGGIVIWRSLAAPNPNLQGDLNNDNTVNITDLSILLSNYGTTNSSADINSDGTVNVLDLSILLSHYGQSYTGGGSSLGTKLPARMALSTGTTYYVDGTNGLDTNNGSSSAPWKTINHALSTVPLSGSIIRVRPGTYNGIYTSYPIQFSRAGDVNNPITLMADQPGTVTIGNGDPTRWTIGAWIHGASGLRIQGFKFLITTNPNIDGSAGAILVENSDKIEAYNNTFYEVGVISVVCRGGALGSGQTADDFWVLDNTFRPSGSNVYAQVTGLSYSNTEYFGTKGSHWIYGGQWGADGASVGWNQVNGCNRMVVANNVFTGSTAGRDIEFGPEIFNSFIVNNTFFGNQPVQTIGMGLGPGTDACPCYAGQGMVFFANTSNTAYSNHNNVVINNIFMDLYGHAGSGSGPAESGNLFQNNLSYKLTNGGGYDGPTNVDYYPTSNPLFSTGTGNLASADPLFNNALGFDFTLKVGSPAYGKSDPAYTYPFDITGKARPASADLGAYQH